MPCLHIFSALNERERIGAERCLASANPGTANFPFIDQLRETPAKWRAPEKGMIPRSSSSRSRTDIEKSSVRSQGTILADWKRPLHTTLQKFA